MSDKITIEQSAAQQIGEAVSVWLAARLDINIKNFKAAVSIAVTADDDGRFQVSMKAKQAVKTEPTPFEFIVEDPAQMELPSIAGAVKKFTKIVKDAGAKVTIKTAEGKD